MLWKMFKVVIRGHIISFESAKKRKLNSRLREIEEQLSVLEEKYRTSLLQSEYNEILKMKYEYNSILNKHTSNLLLKLKQKNFELGDKPEKLLANQLRGEQAKRAIHRIKVKSGSLRTQPKDINDCFREFYEDLHSSKMKATEADFSKFLSNLEIPHLDNASRKDIDSAIS